MLNTMIAQATNTTQEILEVLPALLELQSKPQWVNWSREVDEKGNPTKVPYNPKGYRASSANPETWSTYEAVKQAFDKSQLNGKKFQGVGYELAGKEIGVDLDGCIDPETGEIAEWAMKEVKRWDTYWEVSPSGTGLRGIGKGRTPDIEVRVDGKITTKRWSIKKSFGEHTGIEIYNDSRYLTITGNHLPGTSTELKDCSLAALYAFNEYKDVAEKGEVSEARTSDEPFVTDAWTDDELVDRAKKAKNGEKFSLLWDGDFEEAGFGSQSEADASLCATLAFWTGRHWERMDRLFRASGLMRGKWDRNARYGETYGEGTIRMAIENCEEVFTPRVLAPVEVSEETEPRKVSDETLVKFDASDAGNAEAVKALYGDRILHTEGYGWMCWEGTHWVRDTHAVRRMVVTGLRLRRVAAAKLDNEKVVKVTSSDGYRVNSCIELLKDILNVGQRDVAVFDTELDLLNVKNGVLNLRTGELKPHSHTQRFTYCLTVNYNPDADYGKWVSFLNENVGDADNVVRFLQEAVGYSLTGYTSDECLFYVFGPTRGGKGSFVEVLRALLVKPLSDETNFGTFTAKRDGSSPNYDLAPLKAARVVVASESEKSDRLNGSLVKNITGGGAISCEFKYHDRFTYLPQFKIWLTTNWPANGDVDDGALWNRLRIIEFPNSYEGREDPTVKQNLKKEESLEGVLFWAVQGAMRWFQARKLNVPDSCTNLKNKHREEADSVGQWIEDCCTLEAEVFTTKAQLRTSYENWCHENGFEAKQAKNFNLSLQRRHCDTNAMGRDKLQNNKVVKGIKGIKLNQ